MASTYTLITSQTLASSAASVTFSAIPSTYTDLVVKVSARTDSGGTNSVFIQPNGSTSGYSSTTLRGNGSTASSSTRTSDTRGIANFFAADDSGQTANTFGNAEAYIPSYTASQYKPVGYMGVTENNATAAGMEASAVLWSNTAAITSLLIQTAAGVNFVTGSSFYLYGISNA
jgi:hypothetical protein